VLDQSAPGVTCERYGTRLNILQRILCDSHHIGLGLGKSRAQKREKVKVEEIRLLTSLKGIREED
jgi:hypothetical protein